MTEMIGDMKIMSTAVENDGVRPIDVNRAAIREMVKSAKERGLAITGPDGLLGEFTKLVLETALDEEMNQHLGYEKHSPKGRDRGNSRNGTRKKTVITNTVGEVEIEVPRDRDGSFTPVIIPKRQRRLGDIDQVILSLYSRGLTTGEIRDHFAEIYGMSLSKDVVTTITDRVIDEMAAWATRPLQSHYVAVFVDAIHVKVRDGHVANRPFYAAIGVDLQGHRDVLGIWAGSSGQGESSKYWLGILTELKNRGVEDIFFLVCDGLKGMPDSVGAVFKNTTVQTCVIHLIRNSFKYASKRYWAELSKDLKAIYTAPSANAAWDAFLAMDEKWGDRYPAIGKMWHDAWEQFIPFLDYDLEIRKVLCSTNAIESLNARFRRAINARGHFPNEQAAMKVLYLVVRSMDPQGTGQQRWMMRWKPVLNVMAIQYHGRMPETATL